MINGSDLYIKIFYHLERQDKERSATIMGPLCAKRYKTVCFLLGVKAGAHLTAVYASDNKEVGGVVEFRN